MRILTLDIGGTAIKSAIMDNTKQLSDIRITPSHTVDPELLIQKAVGVAKKYEDFDVLSVSMTGQIDDEAQTVLFQYNKERRKIEFPAGKRLHDALKCSTFLLNDSNAAALGEAIFGAGQAYKDFLCLTYGTGVGGGIIWNSELFRGHRGIAGEIGHMVVHAGGRLCGCGHRGCYEQYASATALLRMAKRINPKLENARQLFEAANQDLALQRVIQKWIGEIVEGLCTLTYIFNPACFILGGGVMERDDVLEQVRAQFYERVIPSFLRVDILRAQLGNQAGMFGAAAFAIQQLKK